MTLENKRVAIIGAGPAGAIALESFLKQGFKNIVVIERRPVVGGTWSLDELIGSRNESGLPTASEPVRIPADVESGTRAKPVVSGKVAGDVAATYEGTLYPQVETNVTANLMAFTSKPFADIKPEDTFERFGIDDAFRSHEVVRQYVVEYFEGRDENLLLNTAVEKAFKKEPHNSPWTLVLHESNKWWTEEFDYLYVSAGRFNAPRIPDISGLSEAIAELPKRTIIHTKAFRGPEEFAGKEKVLLLGASFSNSDVAHLIKDSVHLPVHLSLRGIEEYNLRNFLQPWIVAHPGVKKFEINKEDPRKVDVIFSDNSVLEAVEKVVLGTGYLFSYPFLDEYTNLQKYPIVSADGSQTRNLYWFTWWAADPTLAVSSAINEGITWRVMEAQAKASSYLWSGKGQQPLPSTEEATRWEAERRAVTGERLFQRWHPHYDVLFEGLARTSVGAPQFPGEQVDYSEYVSAVENSLNLKGQWYSRLAAQSIAEHPEWTEQYEQTTAFLKAHERPFASPAPETKL